MTDQQPSPPGRCCPVLELRQYLLQPGQRERLVELFDQEFVESQEALGISVIGQFRDLDRPDYFVWLRGFADMPARAQALAAFHGGPVWQAYRDAANATMIDSDNVLLLRRQRATARDRGRDDLLLAGHWRATDCAAMPPRMRDGNACSLRGQSSAPPWMS